MGSVYESSYKICNFSKNNQTVNAVNSIDIYARSYIDDLVMHNFWPEQNDTNHLMEHLTAKVILDLLSKDETIKGMIIN